MLNVLSYSTPEGMKYGVYEDGELVSKLYPTEKEAQIQLIKISFEKKQQDPNPGHTINLEPPKIVKIDPSSPTTLKLKCITSGIMSGQVTLSHITEKHIEVLLSFESYYSKNGFLTEKQFKWCNSILLQYNNIIIQLMKDGIKPVEFQQKIEPAQVVDHRQYERKVEFDEPKKSSMRGKLIKEEE